MERGASRSIAVAERRPDALVVGDDLVRADLLDVRRVEAADDRDPLPARGDEERSLPGAVRAGDQVEARIAREQRLAHEREPEVDVLLAEDPDRLVELLSNESRTTDHGVDPTGGCGNEGYDDPRGAVAEWLGRGLQSLVQRFESARRLRYDWLVTSVRHSTSGAATQVGSGASYSAAASVYARSRIEPRIAPRR